MTNTDKVVDYVLKNVSKLEPSKIKALADMVKALGGEVEKSPNDMPAAADTNIMDEEQPLDMSKINKVVIDGAPKPIKIF